MTSDLDVSTFCSTTAEMDDIYDVFIVGGGVVGISILRSATLAGWKCVLVEKESDLLSCASGSNSGIVCTGVDASPGTLERALIRDSMSRLRPFLQQHNVPYRPCGSLVCEWPWDARNDNDNRLDAVLQESHDAGDTHATRLTPQQVQNLEPNLADCCRGAVHIPGECVLDSWLYSVALAVHARENGATIYTNFHFDAQQTSWNAKEQTWTVSRGEIDNGSLEQTKPKTIRARSIVNAAGIHADLVQAGVKDVDSTHWEARPRRGQYRVFTSTAATLIHHPIQPVPTQRTKGIFVFSTLYNQIVVGPTAQDQESRTDLSVDPKVATELTDYAMRILPDMQPQEQHVGEYVGIRPGTNHRDYQMRLFRQQNWIVAAGIRSTGLTASLGIGRHIVHLLQMILPMPVPLDNVRLTPLPPVSVLVEDYHLRADGTVMIHGEVYRVTHPITRLGWDAKTGIAKV